MNEYIPVSSRRLYRTQFIQLLDAANSTRSYRFGRQAALAWLAIFPGDLHINLCLAKLLLGEGKTGQALPMLDRLGRIDPESAETYRVIAQNTYGSDNTRYDHAVTSLVALKEGRPAGPAIKSWGHQIREARLYQERGAYKEAWAIMNQVLDQGELSLVAQVFHLRLVAATQEVQSLYKHAENYYTRNTDCLPFNLFLADTLMQLGNETEAVRLLHKSMSMDAAGQVAAKIWGKNHPYKSIWPEELSISFDLQVPADVASKLGWAWLLPEPSTTESQYSPVLVSQATPEVVEKDIPDIEPEISTGSSDECENPNPDMDNSGENSTDESSKGEPEKTENDDLIRSVEVEFEKLAKHLKKPAISRTDGRYPVYVIFTSREGLERQYGPQTTKILDTEMRRLADAARRRTGWETILYYADDGQSTSAMGLKPVSGRDPWKFKHGISDLDKALAKKGLMIGMMLIVGGPEIIPFHELPNPTDDFDEKIYSDNPYATLDSNYFVPEWPLGRLPGAKGADAGPLLEQLRHLIAYHNRRIRTKKEAGVLDSFLSALRTLKQWVYRPKEKPNFGYTAAVWRRSSVAVFRPVGNPHQVLVSPPQVSTTVPVDKMLAPELCYYNLHGLAEAGEWYGQRDPGEPTGGPDYPIALSPKELKRNGHAPRVVFSEACYSAHVMGKTEEDALSLKFLSLGTLAVIGSTCISYGTVNTPLVAADLLGNIFWQEVRSGRTVGDAFMAAKVELVREMVKRQGFLDSEDQKTLLSFVLYGDPLVGLEAGITRAKNIPRFKRHPAVKTIDERPISSEEPAPISGKVIEQVKSAVSSCLPGIESANMMISEEALVDGGSVKSGSRGEHNQARYVVTLSKQISSARAIHRHYARATVQNGKIVKLVVSR